MSIACLLLTPGSPVPENVKPARLIQVPDRVFRTISGTLSPQGTLALVEPPAPSRTLVLNQRALVVVLDSIQDPGNAGTIARSAEALGASGLVFLNATAHPLSPKTLRASAGSLFRIPFVRSSAESDIPTNFPIFAGVADPNAPAAWDCNLAQSCTIVIGNEGSGVSSSVLRIAQPIRIPTRGVESLNAAVAASLLLYEAARQRKAHEPL